MRVELSGQVAVVTGGANGIGRAIVEALAANGAQVVILDREAAVAEATAQEVRDGGGACLALPGDVTDQEGISRVAGEIRERCGAVSLLINNAGINTQRDRVTLEQYSPEDWHRILSVDLTGVFNVSRAFLPQLQERGGGRVVNISSVAGMVPLRLQSAFVAAKAGVINLTRSMALEFGPHNILVNCVAPGSTLTRGTEALFYGQDGAYTEKAASLISHIPQGRPGTPEEIAAVVLFLCSPPASYVNGAIIPVDGGWTAGYTRDW